MCVDSLRKKACVCAECCSRGWLRLGMWRPSLCVSLCSRSWKSEIYVFGFPPTQAPAFVTVAAADLAASALSFDAFSEASFTILAAAASALAAFAKKSTS